MQQILKRAGKNKDKANYDNDKKATKSFAEGLNFYKIFWLGIIFSILGFLIETVWCFIKMGHIESRKGLIYGPFSQIYGIGCIFFILLLKKFHTNRASILFVYSTIFGAIFEYVCSFVQQATLGSVSWEYSKMQFSINGRTNIIYAIFWGTLGTILIKYVYPVCSRWVERIPNKIGVVCTWILFIFVLFDMFISVSALERQEQRRCEIPPQNEFEVFLDSKYTDNYLKEVYPNMEFK